MKTRAPIAVVGSSTLVQLSPCDTDRRTVIESLADLTGHDVQDLSIGGQSLSESINLAAIAGLNSANRDVVLPLAHPYIDDWTTPPFHRLMFFKMMVPQFDVFRAASTTDFLEGFTNQPLKIEQSYTFEGHHYPDYRVLATGTFLNEKQNQTCPEMVTHDWDFSRSYYWWTHVAKQENPSLSPLIGDLADVLGRRGRRLHVVVLPTNLDLLGKFDPEWPKAVLKQQQDLIAELSKRSVDVIDLSQAFSGDEFTTQWCACIHFNQKGRLHLASAIAADLRDRE